MNVVNVWANFGSQLFILDGTDIIIGGSSRQAHYHK